MITLKQVKKYYRDGVGLEQVSLCFGPGEIVGILGENGAGKTTLMKAIMGLVYIDEGDILVDEKPVSHRTYHDLAFISEECSLFADLNAREHEAFFAANFPRFDKARFAMLMDFFQLDEKKRVASYSKGQKAKLELAVGMSKGARYILMDEPFMGNDAFTRADFLKLLAGLLTPEQTLLISTHLLEEVEQFLTRAVFFQYGAVKGDFTMEELEGRGETLIQAANRLFGYDQARVARYLEQNGAED